MTVSRNSIFGVISFAVLGLSLAGTSSRADENQAPAGFVEVSQCKEADYVQGGATNLVKIVGFSFSPRCLRVPVGSQVTIQAAGIHPVQGMDEINGVANPLINSGGGVTTPVTVTIKTAGQFGFYCENHGKPDGTGMAGAILAE